MPRWWTFNPAILPRRASVACVNPHKSELDDFDESYSLQAEAAASLVAAAEDFHILYNNIIHYIYNIIIIELRERQRLVFEPCA